MNNHVLVIDNSSRGHAIVKSLLKSSFVNKVSCAPGNAGIQEDVDCYSVDLNNNQEILELCKTIKPDLVMVGPEKPLANGIVDLLTLEGFLCFGPTKQAARLESSKIFSKKVMISAGILTPKYFITNVFEVAKEYIVN